MLRPALNPEGASPWPSGSRAGEEVADFALDWALHPREIDEGL